jgi:hypothetical protein
MVILGEMLKSRPQSSTRIVSAAPSPRQSKFREKANTKGQKFAQEICTEIRHPSRAAAKEGSPLLALSLSNGRKPWEASEK